MKNQRILRRGFTLIEITIVLGIIAALAAILIPVSLTLTERGQIPRAAEMLAGELAKAQTRAIFTKRPAGIRLIRMPDTRRTPVGSTFGLAWYSEIVPIEDPGDFNEGWVWGYKYDPGNPPSVPTPLTRDLLMPAWPANTLTGVTATAIARISVPNANVNLNVQMGVQQVGTGTPPTTATGPILPDFVLFGPLTNNNWQGRAVDPFTGAVAGVNSPFPAQKASFSFYAANNTRHAFVERGDRIEVDGVGTPFTVLGVDPNFTINAASNIFASAIWVDKAIPTDIAPTNNRRPNYRVIRQPRVAAGMPVVKLPQDTVIDVTNPINVAPVAVQLTDGTYRSGVSTGLGIPNITGLNLPAPATNQEAPPYIDILFSPSGELLPTTQIFRATTNPVVTRASGYSVGSENFVALWIHPWSEPTSWRSPTTPAAFGTADNQMVVTISSRTGAIGSFKVRTDVVGLPLDYAHKGIGRADGDTDK